MLFQNQSSKRLHIFKTSVRFSHVTVKVFRQRTIQQRSSSRPFCGRLSQAVPAWRGTSFLWSCPSIIFSAAHGIAHPPRWPEGWFWRGCNGAWFAQIPLDKWPCDVFAVQNFNLKGTWTYRLEQFFLWFACLFFLFFFYVFAHIILFIRLFVFCFVFCPPSVLLKEFCSLKQ